MKLYLVLFASTMASQANAHGLRRLQTCPVPDPNMPCTANYDPVSCGMATSVSRNDNLACEYDNDCLANLAGFNAATECIKVNENCPFPALGACTANYLPVQCGEFNCEYDNACLANLAGFANTQCTEAMPEPPANPEISQPIECPQGEGMCTMEYNPVMCGPCEYSNPCGAELAGFNPTTDCVSALECPQGEGMCTMEYNPVMCGTCEYSNPCGAELAGYNPETDCVSALPTCPEMEQGMCTMEYVPVKCGELECEYSNACNAGLAGFNAATECTSATPEEPLPSTNQEIFQPTECPVGEGMCTMEYNPVMCGACEYSNPCGAELAGFNPETDCVSSLPTCPEMAQGICTMEYVPVKCGELECEYDNACNAGLAGFNAETECAPATPEQPEISQPIECPVGEGMCTMEYLPVMCGACEYSNPCGAELAGFNPETDCSPTPECPIPGQGICTADYNPVRCGELACEYPNACNAELAGFDVEAECHFDNPQQGQPELFTSSEFGDASLDDNASSVDSSATALGMAGSLIAGLALLMV